MSHCRCGRFRRTGERTGMGLVTDGSCSTEARMQTSGTLALTEAVLSASDPARREKPANRMALGVEQEAPHLGPGCWRTENPGAGRAHPPPS